MSRPDDHRLGRLLLHQRTDNTATVLYRAALVHRQINKPLGLFQQLNVR